MTAYFIRRFLLLLPTLLGATLVVFGLTRIVPGGPMEKAMQQALAMGDRGGGGRDAGGSLSEEQKEQLAAYYGFDRPFLTAYCVWLGIWPREESKQLVSFEDGKTEMAVTLKILLPKAEWKPNNAYQLTPATVGKHGWRPKRSVWRFFAQNSTASFTATLDSARATTCA
jgi:microcin C transport system permease protein